MGFYCYEDNGAPITMKRDCPEGFFCPAGTGHYGAYPCPIGYYNELKNKNNKDQCNKCPAKWRCNRKGMPSYNMGDNACVDGYICN